MTDLDKAVDGMATLMTTLMGEEITRRQEAIDSRDATIAQLREALRNALDQFDRRTCTHEDINRGGFLWTICEDCGAKWADDEGGFRPYEDPPEIVHARTALAASEEPKP